ncbi:MAG: DUF2490 domain-containing protein [Algibacter sp.]|uniref:DUF2490 domain-containing protein n=1 Tax=Algibacter sp. TaxID=1872428 RepID=UPI002635DA08|nr:DUF2490 domain-containing protein [Algibacter sp.]MDG1731178.1 DUF2490 domain-containing protein [Algibacter sp.]MDG2178039.1 DUF2490 domain-containing protein [Algibacter sp.]
MRCINLFLTLVLCFSSFNAISQIDFSTLGESALSINHKVSKEYSINFAFRSRYFLYNHKTVQYLQQQVDFYHFSTFKLNYSHKLSFGVYYRNRDWFETGSDELRFTQQFNYTKQKLGVRYGHRFRAEQRILENLTIFRQRYRFAVDFPLNGEKLDIGETYLVSAIESLLSLSKTEKFETDIRISAQIGWQITQDLKLQTGLEHRLEAFNLIAKNNLFVLTSAILKI